MNKQHVAYPHNGILHSNQELSTVHMDEPHKHYAKGRKPETKKTSDCDSSHL